MEVTASSWSSYPHVRALGHGDIVDLFLDPVVVQEKIDGSQMSFGVFGGELRMRSKGADIREGNVPDLFAPAAEYILSIKDRLVDGWTYRGEAVCRPRHNVLKYDRIPKHGIILFDISPGLEQYTDPCAVIDEGDRLGLECVPTYEDRFTAGMTLNQYVAEKLERISCLGGCTIEGVVFKNYRRFGADGHALMGKYVSEKFKEQHKKAWAVGESLNAVLVGEFRTEARWQKAVQHLSERGELTGSPKDIGMLFKEVHKDLLEEYGDYIKERLFKQAWGHISRGVTGGLAEWYKARLMAAQPVPPASPPGFVPEGCTDDPDPYGQDCINP